VKTNWLLKLLFQLHQDEDEDQDNGSQDQDSKS